MGKLTQKLFAGACAVTCITLLILPVCAQVEPDANPAVGLTIQILLMLGLVFAAVLLTKPIAILIDRIRKKRKD